MAQSTQYQKIAMNPAGSLQKTTLLLVARSNFRLAKYLESKAGHTLCLSSVYHQSMKLDSKLLGEHHFPEEIWLRIFLFCDLDETLALEKTCRAFRRLISSRYIWNRRLQELDQDHAPNLLPHVFLSSLSWEKLRDIVIRAERRHNRCAGPNAPRPTREITVDIHQSNKEGTLGQPSGWGSELFLLPGGEYLFVKWPKGVLQCWNVLSNKCIWTYPSAHTQGRRICNFACELQGENIIVAMTSEGMDRDERSIEVHRFDPKKVSTEQIFVAAPTELNAEHGLTIFVKINGDMVVAYTEMNLVVCFWEKGQWVVIKEGSIDTLDIKSDYMLAVISCFPTTEMSSGNKLIAIPIDFLRKHVQSRSDVKYSILKISEVSMVSCDVTPPGHWICGRAQFSACNFHWKEQWEQKLDITVICDLYRENDTREWPVLEFLSFRLDLKPVFEGRAIEPTFVSLGGSRALLADTNYSSYSVLSPPSQARATVVAFHIDDRREGERTLRAYTCYPDGKELKINEFDEKALGHRPATHSLNMEFYSGAIYFVEAEKQSVIIQYFD